MLARYGEVVPFSQNLNKKLKQLKANFNRTVQKGLYVNLMREPLDLDFHLFLEDMFDNWQQVFNECSEKWFWYDGKIPDANTFCSNGGGDVLEWFFWFMKSEGDKKEAALIEYYRVNGFNANQTVVNI